jgi:hypothetical protein
MNVQARALMETHGFPLSRWTLHRIPQDVLPYELTRGGHRRYRQEDVLRYLESKGVTSAAPEPQPVL